MTRITNPLLMVVPMELLGLVMVGMIVVGGLMTILGARKGGLALVGLAIALPFISVVVEVLMNEVFTAVPERLVLPLAWLIMAIAYLLLFGAFVTALFGRQAVDHAKGDLLASAVKGVFRFLFWWPAMIVWLPLLAFLVWFKG